MNLSNNGDNNTKYIVVDPQENPNKTPIFKHICHSCFYPFSSNHILEPLCQTCRDGVEIYRNLQRNKGYMGGSANE